MGAVAMASTAPAPHSSTAASMYWAAARPDEPDSTPGATDAHDVVEVVDERRGRLRGERLAAPHDLVAALKVERARRVREQLRVADDDGRAGREHLGLGDGLEDDLGADAGGVAHRDADARPLVARARVASRLGWLW